ncbi:MAG: hypothetical protein AB8H86_11000 [Polyangiales bacterium]
MVFTAAGQGLLVAASGYEGDKGRLVQWNLLYNGTNYYLANANYLTNTHERTRRPFGIAYDDGADTVMVVWRNASSNRSMSHCTKTSFGASTRCGAPATAVSQVVNGVNLAYDPPNNVFTAAFSYE